MGFPDYKTVRNEIMRMACECSLGTGHLKGLHCSANKDLGLVTSALGLLILQRFSSTMAQKRKLVEVEKFDSISAAAPSGHTNIHDIVANVCP